MGPARLDRVQQGWQAETEGTTVRQAYMEIINKQKVHRVRNIRSQALVGCGLQRPREDRVKTVHRVSELVGIGCRRVRRCLFV